MFIKHWKTEIATVPNLLSLFRIVLLPVYVRIYLTAAHRHEYLIAGGILALSCMTDLLDGMIARHFNQITNLGKILDPLADKVTQFTLTLCLSLKYPALHPVLALFVVKEVFQIAAGMAFLRKGRMLPGALMIGKICTTVLFVSLIGLVVFPDMSRALVGAIAVTDGMFLTVSFVSYILAYFGPETKVQDLKENKKYGGSI